MKRFRVPFAAYVLGTCAVFFGSAAAAQTAPRALWVQWAADGAPHARAIVRGACPSIVALNRTLPMAVRALPSDGFPDTVCDAALTPDVQRGMIGGTPLPAIPRAPQRIAMFGDTGCRLKGDQVQACNDEVAWPLARVARAIAAEKPDLIVHVGDYYYRESPCPSGVNCTNSPHGDNADSWNADYFAPLFPAFAAAPLVHVRGNHEDCERSSLGWSRYLSGTASLTCSRHEPVAFVAFDNLVLGNVDTAYGDELDLDPAVFESDEKLVDAQAAGKETWLLTHRPPLAYLAAHQTNETGGTHLAAIVSGHIHLFGAFSFPAAPPQLIVGIGGDNLASARETALLAPLGGIADARFGYAILEYAGNGWDVIVHDADAAVHRRCRLEVRRLTCGAALTGSAS